MEPEKDLFQKLINYLKEHGYPESSFAIEHRIGKYRADLVILDNETGLPIQLFELKSSKNKGIKSFGRKQIKKMMHELGDLDIPAYLVFPSEKSPGFKVQRVWSGKNNIQTKAIEGEPIFDYHGQRRSRIFKKIQTTEKASKRSMDIFMWVCWTMAVIFLILLILIKLGRLSFDNREIFFLTVIVIFIVIPFASRLKFLGFEFERWQKYGK